MPCTTLLDIPVRASPDARHPAPGPLWLPSGAPCEYCCVLLARPRRPLRPSCSVRAPASTALSASTALGSWAFVSTQTGRWPPRSGRPCCARGSTASTGALLKAPPHVYGWCRTRWSCATLGKELKSNTGWRSPPGPCADGCMRWAGSGNGRSSWPKITIPSASSAWPRFGGMSNSCPADEVLVFADELDIHLLPKMGAAWMPKGSQVEVMTPGTERKTVFGWCLELCHGRDPPLPRPPQNQRALS